MSSWAHPASEECVPAESLVEYSAQDCGMKVVERSQGME